MARRIFLVAFVVLLLFLPACRRAETEDAQTSSETGSTSESESDTGVSAPDYDEDGNLNLFSTQERPVIKTSFGYYIFHFDGTQLSHLMVVYDEGTDEAAQELYNTMMTPGYDQSDFVNITCSGKYVVCTASAGSTRYGYLFRLQKQDILMLFYSGRQDAES